MKGFGSRSRVAEGQGLLEARVGCLPPERVPFRRAHLRVLAEDVRSDRDVPAEAKSSMDGFAVRSSDLPGTLQITATIMAADRPDISVGPGHAVRIMTGARIPEGADTVVMVELANVQGDSVLIEKAQAAGTHVLARGEDFARDQVVVPKGRRLRPQDVSMLVSAGALEVAVTRRPRVLIVPTGNELVLAGEPHAGKIVESNSYMLEGLAIRDGAEVSIHPIVRDRPEQLEEVLLGADADLVVVTGGSSVGQEDFGPSVVRKLGELAIHGIEVRPASPTGIGFVGSKVVVLAPGFPVASLVAWDLFARVAVQRMLGTEVRLPYRKVSAKLGAALKKPERRVELPRVTLELASELPIAHVMKGGAALLATSTLGAGFAWLPEGRSELAAGATVDVHLYD